MTIEKKGLTVPFRVRLVWAAGWPSKAASRACYFGLEA